MITDPALMDETPVVKSPADFLSQFQNAPNERQLEAWKQQSPNGRLKIFCPDEKRVYLVRSISGLDEKQIRTLVPGNSSDPTADFQSAAVAKAVLWTNTKPNGTLTDVDLKATSAGLVHSLFRIIEQLSDFYAPEQLFDMTIEV